MAFVQFLFVKVHIVSSIKSQHHITTLVLKLGRIAGGHYF